MAFMTFHNFCGIKKTQLTKSYFSERWLNHQPGDILWCSLMQPCLFLPQCCSGVVNHLWSPTRCRGSNRLIGLALRENWWFVGGIGKNVGYIWARLFWKMYPQGSKDPQVSEVLVLMPTCKWPLGPKHPTLSPTNCDSNNETRLWSRATHCCWRAARRCFHGAWEIPGPMSSTKKWLPFYFCSINKLIPSP